MKKRMFITTIVMMLVLAIALTTSSLAWFSSANLSVTANSATFTATTEGASNVSLKISETTGTWKNSISLASGDSSGTMLGLIPTAAIKPTYDSTYAPDFIGTTDQANQPVDVSFNNYIWAGDIQFNAAKINLEDSKFVIDDSQNPVTNRSISGINSSSQGFYYNTFYIFNADKQNNISSLNFKLTSDTELYTNGTQASDTPSRAYVAIIVFDLASFAPGDVIPNNAQSSATTGAVDPNRGKTVRAYGYTGTDSDIVLAEEASDYKAWIPFAAFTFDIKQNATDTTVPWQYADLDSKTNEAYDWNGQVITSPSTQAADEFGGKYASDAVGFTLNTASLKNLNGKSNTTDTSSTFVMHAGEIFQVSMYAWLDGFSMTEYTDTTVLKVGLSITAAQ